MTSKKHFLLIYIYTIKFQFDSIIYQEYGVIAYFSKNLNKLQFNYSIPEKDMLSLVETLLHNRKMLLRHIIYINTDALNLLYENYPSSRIAR